MVRNSNILCIRVNYTVLMYGGIGYSHDVTITVSEGVSQFGSRICRKFISKPCRSMKSVAAQIQIFRTMFLLSIGIIYLYDMWQSQKYH